MRNLSEILHKIGKHKWDDWQYVKDKSCEQIRKCEYCSETQKQTEHIFPASYFSSMNDCSGHCSKCHSIPSGVNESREYHCTRCGERLA